MPAGAENQDLRPVARVSAIFPVACELRVSELPAFPSPLVFLTRKGGAHTPCVCPSLQDNLLPKCSPVETMISACFLFATNRRLPDVMLF